MGTVNVSSATWSKVTASSLEYFEMVLGHSVTVNVTSELGSKTPDDGCTVNSRGFTSAVSASVGRSSSLPGSASSSLGTALSSDSLSTVVSRSKQTASPLPSCGTCAWKVNGTSLVLVNVTVLAELNPTHTRAHNKIDVTPEVL